MSDKTKITLFGIAAGAVNGLFGTGGGMVLAPMLAAYTKLPEDQIFPTSISIILPICLISLIVPAGFTQLPFLQALPYLIGSVAGGILAAVTAKKIPVLWLHRGLGLLIIWGGIQYIC